MDDIDVRTVSYIEIKDLYTKDGKHQSSVAKTPSGEVVWEEGRNPRKDVNWFQVSGIPWSRA